MVEEILSGYSELKDKLNSFKTLVNEDMLLKRIHEIDVLSEKPDFWNNAESKHL